MIGTLWAVFCRLLLVAACVVFVASVGGLFMLYPHVGLIVAAAAIWQACRRGFGSGWVHGVARTAEWDDLYQANMIGGNTGTIIGTTAFITPPSKRYALVKLFTAPLRRSVLAVRIFLGTFWGMSWCNNMLIRVPDACHLATFSKTGGGKGVSVVIPTLLSDPRSAVVPDPKRENAKITGRHRAKHFGHRVVILDPFGGKDSDCYNPLDGIKANSPDLIDQCKELAAALVVKTGKETEPFFINSPASS